MGPPRTPPWIWGVVALMACKAPAGSAPPQVADDIAEIEARLQSNEDELVAEGVMVAQAAPVDTGRSATYDQPPPPATEPTEEPEAEYDREEAADEARTVSVRRAKKKSSRSDYRERWLRKRRDKKEDAEQCKRICDLAEATCGLADRICDLASRHPDELRYERACTRAETQCELASEACTVCVQD